MRIGFAFTGAGHLLKESVQVAEKLAEDHEVTIFLSGAAEEVLKMYGLYDRVVSLTGGKYRELATDSNQKFSFPITGRLSLGKYDLLIVSPATANTVSKIVIHLSHFMCKINLRKHLFVTLKTPFVNVPVLSKTIYFTSFKASK